MKKTIFISFFVFLFSALLLAQTVYITKTGKKYHTETCSYLRKSSIPISLKDAVDRGYTPCSRCNPSILKENSKLNTEVKKKETIKKIDSTKASTDTYKGRTIYTGPRGGKYYINKNGKKTYIKRK